MSNVAPTQVPILSFLNNAGRPNVGGSLLTQVGGVNYPTYQDPAGTIPLPNPIPLNSRGEISNSSGVSSQIFLEPGVTYTFTLYDPHGNQIWVAENIGAIIPIVVNSIAALETLPPAGLFSVFVTGYRTPSDGGGGTYSYSASTPQSSANGGTIIAAAGGVGCWILNLIGPVSIKQFGAYGDGAHSDDTAMTNWLSVLSPTIAGYAPAGTYNFSTQKVLPLLNGIRILGDGARQTVFQYTGVSTTNDLWVAGNGTTSLTGWSLSGFRFDSSTVMTAGAALHLELMESGNELFDIDVGLISGTTKNLYHGIWADNVNVFKYTRGNGHVQGDALRVNGSQTSAAGSDVFLDDLALLNSGIGLHIGGGQGGVYVGKVLGFGNTVNYQIDNALAAQGNRELFFSDLCVSDGCVNYGFYFNDTLATDAPVAMNADIASAGLSGTGGIGINMYVKSWPAGRITIGPGQLYNATSDGLRVDDTTCIISISPARHIFNNGGYGVNATAVTTGIYNDARYQSLNVLGNQSANVHNPSWQSFSTTVTATSGTITTLGTVDLFYQLAGGVCHFTADISITTNGTGAGSVNFTLPRAAVGFGNAYGKDNLTGKSLAGLVAASNVEALTFFDGTYPGADGCQLIVSGSYQYL